MQRINIIGVSGAGKSTFAKELAKKLGYEHIELDNLHWRDNWQEASEYVFLTAAQKQVAKHPMSVIDGNYMKKLPIKQREVDTIIWLNYSFSVVFYRALKRALTRIITREKLWDTNNVERLGKVFSKESIVWFTIKTFRKKRKDYSKLINNPDYKHIKFIEFKSPREACVFLDKL